MKILSVNARQQKISDELNVTFVNVKFDEEFESYSYDKTIDKNAKVKTDSIRVPATVFNAICYGANENAGKIASGLFASGHDVWWNMVLVNADIDINIKLNEEEEYNEFEATKLVFAKDELTQDILHYGLYVALGIKQKEIEKLENKITESLLSAIPDEL